MKSFIVTVLLYCCCGWCFACEREETTDTRFSFSNFCSEWKLRQDMKRVYIALEKSSNKFPIRVIVVQSLDTSTVKAIRRLKRKLNAVKKAIRSLERKLDTKKSMLVVFFVPEGEE